MPELAKIPLLLAVLWSLLCFEPAVWADQCQSPEAEPDYAGRVLWLDAENEHAVFLPATVLNVANLNQLPLSQSDREIIEYTIQRFQDNERGYCDRIRGHPEQGTSPDARPFSELLDDSKIVFEGTVQEVVDGWSPWTNQISQVAYVRVDAVLKGSQIDGAPSVGQTLGVLFPGGRVVVSGTVLCADPVPGLYSPRTRERVLVSGSPWSRDERFFNADAKFPIIDDGITAQAYSTLRSDQIYISLEDLKRALKSEAVEEVKQ